MQLEEVTDEYQFIYDSTASIPAVIQEFSSSGRNMVYIREPDGSLVARFEPGEDPVAQYYYFDGLGSTVMLTEGLSTITDRYDYDAWGNEYPIMASTVDNPYRYVGELGYYTHWMDSSLTDLLHLGVRFYEPGVGRFSQRDGLRDGLNLYAYAYGVPTSAIDPSGYLSWTAEVKLRFLTQFWDDSTGRRIRPDISLFLRPAKISSGKGAGGCILGHCQATVYCGGNSTITAKGKRHPGAFTCSIEDLKCSNNGPVRVTVDLKGIAQDIIPTALGMIPEVGDWLGLTPGNVNIGLPIGRVPMPPHIPGHNTRCAASMWAYLSIAIFR